jgi:lysophospholipase L1-like esterase
MGRIRLVSVLLVLVLLFPQSVFAVDSGTVTDSLQGKTILILGDSYSASYQLNPVYGWPHRMAELYDLTILDHAISGSTLATGENDYYPMVERCKDLEETDVDIVIVQGASNDYSRSFPIGTMEDRQEDTVLGALNLIFDTISEKYPTAQIVAFTPWVSTGTENDLGLETSDYTQAMLALCESRNILCYDASDSQESGIHMDEESFRSQYCLSSTDRWHLNEDGQALFAPVFGRWLDETLYGAALADRFSDLACADEAEKEAVSQVYEAGLMEGISDSLFAPTQAATREALALTLYRLAGSPQTEALTFSDVSPDWESYSAICWAVSQGLLETQDSFGPKRSITRGVLVSALYGYYQLKGGEVLAMTGLGRFSDQSSLPPEQRTAWGWALHENLLSASSELRPQSMVSRLQLAQALAGLLHLD